MSKPDHKPSGITSTDALAKHLGLSRWTVSRVLNGHPGVSPETVERIRKAMDEAGFEPSPHARFLRGGPTRMIGVCIQELESPSLIRKAGILQKLFRESGYDCLLELTHRNRSLEEKVIRHFISLRVGGIVCIGTRMRKDSILVRTLQKKNIPVVLVDPEIPLPFPCVEVDRAYAMESMLSLLQSEGHKYFGFLGFDPKYAYSEQRMRGAEDFFARQKAEFLFSLYEKGTVQHDYEYGARLAGRFLEQDKRPDVLVCVNDRVAISLISTLQREGWAIPGDVAVAGHDNLDVSSYFNPPLTTADQDIPSLMEKVRDLVLEHIDGELGTATELVKVRPKIMVRQSHLSAANLE